MTDDDYVTIRVPEEVRDRANEARKARGETWGEFLKRALDAEPVGEFTESDVRRIVRDEIESYLPNNHH